MAKTPQFPDKKPKDIKDLKDVKVKINEPQKPGVIQLPSSEKK